MENKYVIDILLCWFICILWIVFFLHMLLIRLCV